MHREGRGTDAHAALAPVSGSSRDGRPLAFHRAPAPDLAPWIARLFVTAVDQPEAQAISCHLLNDAPFLRVIVRGDWVGEPANGTIECSRGLLMFGAHSRAIPIRVGGPFATFGLAFTPGALETLGHPWGRAAIDCIIPAQDATTWSHWLDLDDRQHSPEQILDQVERDLRAYIDRSGASPPSALASAFDQAAFADPGQPIRSFAERQGVSARRVERMALRDFGLPPRQIMRRARVLDMASQLLRLADDKEAEEHALRFYDQSHLIRDFRLLLGCTPRQLVQAPRPILSLGLETRQARRLELLGKVGAEDRLPWR